MSAESKENREVISRKRDLTDEEIEVLVKTTNRNDYAEGFSYKDFKVAYFRQGNFTIAYLFIPDTQPVCPGVAKKHPDYDPDYREEVGKTIALKRSWENFFEMTNVN